MLFKLKEATNNNEVFELKVTINKLSLKLLTG